MQGQSNLANIENPQSKSQHNLVKVESLSLPLPPDAPMATLSPGLKKLDCVIVL